VIRPDHTFEYQWQFDLASSWSVGLWFQSRDTLYLNVMPVLDTFRRYDSDKLIDSMVLSADQKPNLIGASEYLAAVLSGGGQDRHPAPNKLVTSKGRLYNIGINGKPITRSVKHALTGKSVVPWFALVRTP
jgi:hypothetical protein